MWRQVAGVICNKTAKGKSFARQDVAAIASPGARGIGCKPRKSLANPQRPSRGTAWGRPALACGKRKGRALLPALRHSAVSASGADDGDDLIAARVDHHDLVPHQDEVVATPLRIDGHDL